MEVTAFVLGTKEELENKHEKASTGVQKKLYKENANIYLPYLDFKRINKRAGEATHLSLP